MPTLNNPLAYSITLIHPSSEYILLYSYILTISKGIISIDSRAYELKYALMIC